MSTNTITKTEFGDGWFNIIGSQLYSNTPVKMQCNYRGDGGPARFRFRDIEIDAHVSNIVKHEEIGLTTIGRDGIHIRQVEHILSALMGFNVLDTTIKLEYLDDHSDRTVISPPACHLNANEFSRAILSTFHRRPKDGPIKPARLEEAYVIRENSSSDVSPSVAIFAPLHKLNVTAHIDYTGFIGTQTISKDITPHNYLKDICWARSFFTSSFPHDVEWEQIRSVFPAVLRKEENHLRSMILDYTSTNWITPVVDDTEPVRHKLLDFLGDIALVGCSFNAGIYVYKPHHKFNRQCAKEIISLLN
ncbi:MAG: UDP-3-O-acyl-N-acetylglucosamine deacetylase [Balneolaceae bacterium]|nr:UDP-3-O-acyl-N-acetylglucosamine deacetylase [Balneolaceae bacterium]